jgi:spore coat polysaccharide biosynthesis predicted glycosyltransferase SpsG
MQVAIRADATLRTGTGHVMRCWALAEEFEAAGATVSWLGEFSVPWVAEALARTEWRVSNASMDDSQEVTAGADVVVVDSYDLPGSYRQGLLNLNKKVVAIVDHHHRELGPATLWVNPGPPLGLPEQDRLLDGVDFVLIRQEIRELARVRAERGSQEHIAFLLGGSDAVGLSAQVATVNFPRPIFAGPGPDLGGNASWLRAGRELLEVAVRSRLVVTTASVTAWEMLHAGVPLAVICSVGNQRGNYDWMTSNGWAFGIDLSRDLSQQVCLALEMAGDEPAVATPLIDGLGARRVVDSALSERLR